MEKIEHLNQSLHVSVAPKEKRYIILDFGAKGLGDANAFMVLKTTHLLKIKEKGLKKS